MPVTKPRLAAALVEKDIKKQTASARSITEASEGNLTISLTAKGDDPGKPSRCQARISISWVGDDDEGACGIYGMATAPVSSSTPATRVCLRSYGIREYGKVAMYGSCKMIEISTDAIQPLIPP